MSEMVAKEAVRLAKQYIRDLYADEQIVDLGLEELEISDTEPETWSVTIGFRRKWQDETAPVALPFLRGQRTYKVVRFHNDGTLVALKHRDVSVPA